MVKTVPIGKIVDNPFQPRTVFDPDALKSLAAEIKAEGFWNGTLQGRRGPDGTVQLVFGHRRLRALRMLKVPSVTIDILDLTDAQMALRSLEENLQREGLTDMERADAVKRAVDLARADLKAAGKNESHAVQQVAERLGLAVSWTHDLAKISSGMPEEIRKHVEAGHVTGQTALRAKEWGGVAYAKTLARQGKEAKTTGKVPKPTHTTVRAMRREVDAAPERVRESLKDEIVAGKVTTPAEAARRARSLAATATRRHKAPPPDLREVIVGWSYRLKDWRQQMEDVVPYMDYIDEQPAIAKKFRDELGQFLATAKKLM